jgi:hypothetical protein
MNRATRLDPRFRLDVPIWCWLADQTTPARAWATDVSVSGLGVLLTPPLAKPGMSIRVQLDGGGAAPWLTGKIVRLNTILEIHLQHVGIRLDLDATARADLEQAVAMSQPFPEGQLSVSDWTITYRAKAASDCANLLPFGEDIGLPLSMGLDGMTVVTEQAMSGHYCTYLFGTSVATTNPTLCFWSATEVEVSVPMPEMAGLQLTTLRFRTCPSQTQEMIAACVRAHRGNR